MRSPPQSFLKYPLTPLFGTPAHVRVLRELVLHGGVLSVAQLAQGSGLTMAGVRIALDNLERLHAVRTHGAGRSRVFEAHPSYPLLEALQSLFMAERDQSASFVDALRSGLEQEQTVRAAWLYGSTARGEDGPSSDLDIAVLAEDSTSDLARRAVEDLLAARSDRQASIVVITPGEIRAGDVDAGWFERLAQHHRVLKGQDPRSEEERCRARRQIHDRQRLPQAGPR